MGRFGTEYDKVHMVVDFMHIYYKYKFMAEQGRLRHLSCQTPNGEEDVTNIYYVIKDIEGLKKALETRFALDNVPVGVTICMDNKPTVRLDSGSEQAKEYKAKRKHSLTDEDHRNIEIILELLRRAGYCVLSAPGYEADDLVAFVIGATTESEWLSGGTNSYPATLVYTNDSDLIANVDSTVHVCVRRPRAGYVEVTKENFAFNTETMLKHRIPYNCVMLYKSLVGDTSDNISGVKGFGPARFDGFLEQCQAIMKYGYRLEALGSPAATEAFIKAAANEQILSGDAASQALESFELVRPHGTLELLHMFAEVQFAGTSTEQSRKAAYMDTYGFKSLV